MKCHAPSTRCYTWRKVGITSNAKPARNRVKGTRRSSHERGQRMHPDILVALLSRGCWLRAVNARHVGRQSHKGSAVAADQPCLTHAPTYPTFLLPFIPICLTQPVTATAPVLACAHDLVSTERIACCYLGNGGWDQQPTTTMTPTMTTPTPSTPPWRECTYILRRCLSYLNDDCSADLRR